MKTSNKLLLIVFLASIFSAISLMVYAKSQMVVWDGDHEDYYYGEGPVIEKLIMDEMTLTKMEMGDNFRYTIDPARSDVTIKGDSAFISNLTFITDNEFRILTGGVPNNFNWPDNVLVVIGTQNLNTLDLDINGNAKINTNGPLSYEQAKFSFSGNGRATLDLSVKELEVGLSGNGRLTLNGAAENLRADLSGNSKMSFENCQMNDAMMRLSGNSRFYGDIITNLEGNASGNAKIEFNEVIGKQVISTSGNGRFTIRN